MSERLVIITGPMRSGTTLLGNMLHGVERPRHPELSFAPDTVTDLREITPIAANDAGQVLPLMNPAPSRRFLDKWIQLAREALPAFKEKVFAIAPAPMASVYGGKLTGLLPEIVALNEIEGLDVRTLVLERDPRDIFTSALKRYGEGSESAALAFMNAALSLDYKESQLPKSMRVPYAQLVTKPRETLTEILHFVGLDPARYDWAALESGLISNSSFANIGPNDVVAGSGLRPSIGRYAELSAFHKSALAEIFELGARGDFKTRIEIYENFLPSVLNVAWRYGYAMHGLQATAEKRRGFMVGGALALRALLQKARDKFQSARYSAERFLKRK